MGVPASGAPVVAIDAGHGGEDEGAIAHRREEKDIALAVSRRLADSLRKLGLRPVLVRDGDRRVELNDRARLARENNAAAFVSIHVDAVRRRKTRGIVIYTYGKNRLIPNGKPRLGQEVLPAPPRSQVRRSRVLSVDMSKALEARGFRVGEADQGAFAVLKSSTVPSVLVEIGNIYDRKESSEIAEPRFQERLAGALAQGIAAFLRR